jgi:hypothetical protein
MMFYGLTRPEQAIQYAHDICELLGHGKNGKAVNMLVETACQETWLGQYKDRHWHKLGVGVCQFDQVGFDDAIARTPLAKINLIIDAFGIDVREVELRDLAFSPFLSMLLCRLKYLRVVAPIPSTLEGRAQYWKDNYNSLAGKGQPEEYVSNYLRHGKKLLEGF